MVVGSHVTVGYALAAPLLIHFPASGLRKAIDNEPSVWIPATYVGDPDQSPNLARPSPGCCDHLGSESGWNFSLALL